MITTLISAVLLIGLDFIFLTSTASIYAEQIRAVQNMPLTINYGYAIATYLIIIFALNHFILEKDASILEASLFGFSIYAVFELTNASLFSNWKIGTVILDTLWGGVLFGIVTGIIKLLKQYINFM